MKIHMLDTVEDSHPFIQKKEGSHIPDVVHDVKLFRLGETYDVPKDRGEKLISFGFAEEVGAK